MTDLLARLQQWGVRPGAALERMWRAREDEALRQAFSEVMGCDFLVMGPDHGIPALDPCFVPIADVGNGDIYGLFCHPRARGGEGDAIVQYLHEGPHLAFEADDFASWLTGAVRAHRGRARRVAKADPASLLSRRLALDVDRKALSQRAALERLLPVEEKISRLPEGGLAGWLLDHAVVADGELAAWEREWALRWLSDSAADIIELAALIDYGMEAYGRLGWPLALESLGAVAAVTEELSKTTRAQRTSLLWSRVHRPSQHDAGALIHAFERGDAHAQIALGRWLESYAWHAVAQHPSRRDDRRALGEQLLSAWKARGEGERAPVAQLIVGLEYEEQLETLEGLSGSAQLVEALRALREQHQGERVELDRANDWSAL